ncbi:hypothetical protein CLV59_102196 [Chitinophaga dinghuensis]|uniref:Uncharacterized protein n=1 Tax=Chitinophaga dinghuensis TaxID=1539050 RepID=A0A327W7Z1_9BACT|nr:hypothetical protein [Chitinophaga dinghuensis]RAJ85493.1 hypothetical protein CLV59_102196 [Chitinophaga dinghuensis]
MKRILFLVPFLAMAYTTSAQDIDHTTAAIEAEGRRLYRSEMASWYGTDIFRDAYFAPDKSGGYLSYSSDNNATCIFYSKGDTPVVIATITFDNTYNTQTAQKDFVTRPLTTYEGELLTIRNKALKLVNTDTTFKSYNNTNLNLVPLISNGERKAYVLTGPKVNGVVIFGNDYLITFDEKGNVKEKKALHKNIIPIQYQTEEGQVTMHSHLPETGDFITPTDICTLMLYEKFAHWKQHIVISQNYYSIWNCLSDQLVTLTKEAWENITKDQEKRRSSN